MSYEDVLIREMTEDAQPEGAIWCSDCGQWIEEACEHQDKTDRRKDRRKDGRCDNCGRSHIPNRSCLSR